MVEGWSLELDRRVRSGRGGILSPGSSFCFVAGRSATMTLAGAAPQSFPDFFPLRLVTPPAFAPLWARWEFVSVLFLQSIQCGANPPPRQSFPPPTLHHVVL